MRSARRQVRRSRDRQAAAGSTPRVSAVARDTLTARILCSASVQGTRSQQPCAGRNPGKIGVASLRHGGETDQPFLERERTTAAAVEAAQLDHLAGCGECKFFRVPLVRGPDLPGQEFEIIGFAAIENLGLYVRISSTKECIRGRATKDPKRRRRMIMPRSASGARALFTVMREQPYSSISSCSKGMRNPGRPFARQNALGDVGADASVEREIHGVVPPRHVR